MMFLAYNDFNPKLKPAIRIKISDVKRGHNPSGNGNADFSGCSENEININLGDFTGNLSEARDKIQTFCNEHEVKYEGLGIGYANLYVDGKVKDITPYHIDVIMMLNIVDENSPESTAQSRSNFPSKKMA